MSQKRDVSTNRLLTWIFTVWVIYAEFINFSDSRVITCGMPSVEEGQIATLTCDYKQAMYPGAEGKDIIMQRENPDGSLDTVLECYWETGATKYKCDTFGGSMADLSHNITRYVKVYFPAVSKKDEGKYYCKTVGPGIRSEPCSFDLKEDGGSSGWKAAFFVILVVGLILALLLAILIYYYRFRNRYLQNKAVIVSNAVESLISIVCSMKLTNANFESPERVNEAWQLASRVSSGGTVGKMTPEVANLMRQLWQDQGLQKFVRENEGMQSAAEYFLNALDRIAAPDYRPTTEDMDRSWTISTDAEKTAFTFKVLHCMILLLTDPRSPGAGSILTEEGSGRETDPLLASNKLLALVGKIRPRLLTTGGADWNNSNVGCIPPVTTGADNKEELSAAENALFTRRNEPLATEDEENKLPAEREKPAAAKGEELGNMDEKRLSKKEEKVSPQGKEDKHPLWDIEKGQ